MFILYLKYFHITCAVLSFSGFALRGYWRLTRPERVRRRWVRYAPHFIDSGLFFSGLAMVMWFRWSPLEHIWLAAKLSALLLYIILGAVTLRRGSGAALWAALATFLYIVGVALSKQAIPFWAF